ncbi:replication initiation protein [Rickettsia endosymbiont of Cardiosporidium cionae]|uniref:replication initiation protein n=1 Tax=Rickettsia endosymbiont of Cardiosporidium cionae TaxID=2777155 RepID=UPI001895B4CA|nr:replication initiation protein [Rickettsia endosymbiont of Cardiosporidium cionae]KAF8818066.1 hypothetical protein IHI24_000865 [Rickettsia endosymbiont of Cardiosporidium cionae]
MNEISLKKEFKKIYKKAQLTKARFIGYSCNDYKVTLTIIPKVISIDIEGRLLPLEKMRKDFSINALELSNLFGIKLNHCYTILRKSIKLLTALNIDLSDDTKQHIVNFCEEAKYTEGSGELNITLTDKILPYLRQGAQRYTLYKLEDLIKFRSFYTIRLYELIQGYKKNGWLSISVESLRKIFNVGPKLQEYRDFKRKTIAVAVNEINKYHPEIDLNFVEIKNKRKVVDIYFTFVTDKNAPNPEDIPKLTLPSRAQLTDKEAKAKIRLQEKRKAKRLADAIAKGILQEQNKAISSADDKDNADDMPRKIGDVIDNMIERNR